MSKWMKNKEKLFKTFKEEANREKNNNRNETVWKTPEKGTQENPKIYKLRLLMDKNDNFYKSFHYHMYYSKNTEKWVFVLCPKTDNFSDYCPFCAAVSKLYMGSDTDKKIAYNFKRKTKFCVNAFIIKDPRDTNKIEEEKNSGKVLIYEFPSKVESKIKSELNDSEYGAGMDIFDPGADGYSFFLKVGATKPMADGNTFPDYGDSKFANKPEPILDSDEEIDKIMETRYDLEKHISDMGMSLKDMSKLLQQEMLWDLIKKEVNRKLSDIDEETDGNEESDDTEDDIDDTKDTEDDIDDTKDTDDVSNDDTKDDSEDDIDDSDLLNELDDL